MDLGQEWSLDKKENTQPPVNKPKIDKEKQKFIEVRSQGIVENDHTRLRHARDRYCGFPIGYYNQTPPLLFSRDAHNVFMGDVFRGNPAFLILGGPSFANIDQTQLNAPGVLTMGVNNSVRSFRPNLWISVDDPTHFMKSIWLDPTIMKFIPYDHAEKRIFDNEKWEKMDILTGDCPNTFFFRRNEVFDAKRFLFENSFNWGNHSDLCRCGYKRPDKKKTGIKVRICPECGESEAWGKRSVMLPAIRMLYYLGCRTIFLLGCDFKMEHGGENYHFDQSRSKSSVKGNNATYKMLVKRFLELDPYFKKVGLQIFNCNLDSGLRVFPFVEFDEAIRVVKSLLPDPETERTEGLYQLKQKDDLAVEITKVEKASMEIKEGVASFLSDGTKKFAEDTVYFIPTEELDKYKIQTRKRENSRPGGVDLDYDSRKKKEFINEKPEEFYEGQEKWDKLVESMEKLGWAEEKPAVFKIRCNRRSRLWDGHHRLTIAKQLGFKTIPVRFIYGDFIEKNQEQMKEYEGKKIYGRVKLHFGNVWALASALVQKYHDTKEPVYVSSHCKKKKLLEQILAVMDTQGADIRFVDAPYTQRRKFGVRDHKGPYVPTKKQWEAPMQPFGRVCYQLTTNSDNKRFESKKMSQENIDKLLDLIPYEKTEVGLPMTIDQIIETMLKCDVFIGICSGMSQIAHSVGIPVILYDWEHLDRCHNGKKFIRFSTPEEGLEQIQKVIV